MARRQATDGYVGKEALTIIRLANGTHAYVYAGQKVPADAPEAEVTRLLKAGFIAEAKAPAKAPARQTSATRQPATGDAGTSGDDGGDGDDDE